jgi:hypothetical protein
MFFGSTYGQLSHEDTAILSKAFRQIASQEQILYIDTVNADASVITRLKEIFHKGELTDKRLGNTITLTKSEQKYLLTELGQRIIWNDYLFTNGKRISSDSMRIFLKKQNTDRVKTINQAAKSKDTLTIKALGELKNYPYVFTFAKPIYIRNNTVCLISFIAMCGNECGQTETSFYKKVNNEWTKWVVVSSGTF